MVVDAPVFDGHWVLCSKQGDTSAWLHEFLIEGDKVIDGTGCEVWLKRADGVTLLEGGVLQLRGKQLRRVGKSGKVLRFQRGAAREPIPTRSTTLPSEILSHGTTDPPGSSEDEEEEAAEGAAEAHDAEEGEGEEGLHEEGVAARERPAQTAGRPTFERDERRRRGRISAARIHEEALSGLWDEVTDRVVDDQDEGKHGVACDA